MAGVFAAAIVVAVGSLFIVGPLMAADLVTEHLDARRLRRRAEHAELEQMLRKWLAQRSQR